MAFLRYESPSTANVIGPAVGRAAGSFLRAAGGASNRNSALAEINQVPADMDPVRYAGTVAQVLAKHGVQSGPVTERLLNAQAQQYQTKQALGRQQALGESVGSFLRAPEQAAFQNAAAEAGFTPTGAVLDLNTPAGAGFLRNDALAGIAMQSPEAAINLFRFAQQQDEGARRFDAQQGIAEAKLDFGKIKDERDFNEQKDKRLKDQELADRRLGLQEREITARQEMTKQKLEQEWKIWQEKRPILETQANAQATRAANAGKTIKPGELIRTTLMRYGGNVDLPAGMDPTSMQAALYMMAAPKGQAAFAKLQKQAATDPQAASDLAFVNQVIDKMQEGTGFLRQQPPGPALPDGDDPLGLFR